MKIDFLVREKSDSGGIAHFTNCAVSLTRGFFACLLRRVMLVSDSRNAVDFARQRFGCPCRLTCKSDGAYAKCDVSQDLNAL